MRLKVSQHPGQLCVLSSCARKQGGQLFDAVNRLRHERYVLAMASKSKDTCLRALPLTRARSRNVVETQRLLRLLKLTWPRPQVLVSLGRSRRWDPRLHSYCCAKIS